jgi:hypothetical protein
VIGRDDLNDGRDPDFFVSYTGADEAWARWIAIELERAGYTTVSQVLDFRPGHDFVHAMHSAVTSAARTIAVLSPEYFASELGEAEWRTALAGDPTGELGLLIPVRVRTCRPPGLLRTRVYIDLVGIDEDTARERLLSGVAPPPPRPITVSFPGREIATADEAPWPTNRVNLQEARGVQIGDGNTQTNTFK